MMRYLLLITPLFFFKLAILAQRDSSAIKRCIPSPDVYQGQPVYRITDNMPMFRNGNLDFMNYMLKDLRYPEITKDSSPIRSTFRVTCVIDTLGKAQDVCCVTPYDYYEPVEKQLIDLVRNSEGWAPGLMHGKKVCVRLIIPLTICFK